MAGIDLDLVRHALETARRNGFAEVELEQGGSAFHAVLDTKVVKSVGTGKSESVPEVTTVSIKSGSVGYLKYSASGFAVGEEVSSGQVIGSVLALGLSSDIESPATGSLLEILVEEGAAVEFGQVIARIEVSK